MTARARATLLLLLPGLALAGPPAGLGKPEAALAEKHRGLNWVAAVREIDAAALEPAARLGAGWIAQTPFGWMRDPASPEVGLVTGGRVHWGETDAGLIRTHRLARELGLRSALKPHLWVRGSWPGAVEMRSEADWRAWFASYERFILHYAKLAQRERIELLVIGTELKGATRERGGEWSRIIARVREVYHGALTYAANWDEVWDVPFWDELDVIGVDAYFPLGTDGTGTPSRADLERAWQPTLERLRDLSRRHRRKVLFTEAGYRATSDCTRRPWEHDGDGTTDECQAVALDALLATFWERPWFAGLYLWKWFPEAPGEGGRHAAFSPQGRKAEEILRRRFGGSPAAAR